MVCGATCCADWDSALFQRSWSDSIGWSLDRKRRGDWHEFGFHDGSHRTIAARVYDSQESHENKTHFDFCQRRWRRHHFYGLSFQRNFGKIAHLFFVFFFSVKCYVASYVTFFLTVPDLSKSRLGGSMEA